MTQREPDPRRAPTPVLRRLAAAVAAHPDRPALVTGAGQLTFAELNDTSAAVAAGLAARGVAAESLVAFCLPRGTALAVTLLGVLRAGAAYLPLDPGYPAQRLAYLLSDSGARLVVADAGTAGLFPDTSGIEVVTPTVLPVAGARFDDVAVLPDQLAYTIYTSGSTGRPKGVEVTHRGLAALLDGIHRFAGAGQARVGWNASVSFDASVQQWLRLCRGDTVVMLDERVRTDPEALIRLIVSARLTDLDITPSQLAVLLDRLRPGGLPQPLRLLVGGEAIGPKLWQELVTLTEWGVVRAVNLYGPTECTVDATATPVEGDLPHLGAPLPGVRLHLLDPSLRPVRDGEQGELYLAGPQVARGYRGRPALTAERFVADPFAGDGSRMYRTGDRARRDGTGSLEFFGRLDDQVKLRGYRIEPGEVESVLAGCPNVGAAVVLPRDDVPGGTSLVGYVLRAGPVDVEDVRAAAARQLPEFMVPAVIVALDSFPLTPNGKVDRSALPAPQRSGTGPAPDDEPRGPVEERVAELWREVLGVDRIRATDDFFRIGGQSLLAIRVVTRLRRELGYPIPLVAVFENPRLRDLAAYIARLDERN